VVPSGSMIISARTLAVYFEKENIQEETIDAGYDIEIFARYIAPAFNISMRFVGEEPTDRVTAQYNEQMKQILPEFGIKLIEIPRKKNADGEVISAGRLRKLLKNGNYKEAQEYVDDWELERLKEIWNRKENG
jgi:[citrate (pro-3S)-lyase] ligase